MLIKKHIKVMIVGSGPAGYSAAIYASRANLSPVIITGNDVGGQLMITTDVENYPGFSKTIQGPFLMDEMKLQALKFGTQIISDKIIDVDFSERPFKLLGDNGTLYVVETLIIATGSQSIWTGIKGESDYRGFGISSCATCDGFFFRNKSVAVIGGGNTAVEESLFLSKLATKVTLIHRRNKLRSEKILEDRLLQKDNVSILWNSVVGEFCGDEKSLKYLKISNVHTKEITRLPVEGAFVAIGHKPSTGVFSNNIDMDGQGYIRVFPGSSHTSIPGVFAAGDVHDKKYRQAVTAAAFGCMSALDVERFFS